MSDLAATNCGGCGCNEGGCNSILWIIILQHFRGAILAAKGPGIRIVGILPEIWLTLVFIGLYVIPLLLAKGGI